MQPISINDNDHRSWLEAALNRIGEDPEVDQLTLSLAHPAARRFIPSDEFLLNATPLSEDIGADVFALYRYWTKFGRPGGSSLVFLEVVFAQFDIDDYSDLATVTNYEQLAQQTKAPEAMARRRAADEIILSTAFSEIVYTGALTHEMQQCTAWRKDAVVFRPLLWFL